MEKDQKEEKHVKLDPEMDEAGIWNDRYNPNATGWDLGEVSPPLRAYIDNLTDKDIRILIPGCGNSYEAEYLLDRGFKNITLIDISPPLVEKLKSKFQTNPNIRIVLGDFFNHGGVYDLVLEQTFFCAINPALRRAYVSKMNGLLVQGGKIAGVLFDKEFEKEGPPYGGSEDQYKILFENDFKFKRFEPCYNFFISRAGKELFINLIKI